MILWLNNMYTDDSIMPRGQYKFHRLKDIPADYFLNLWEHSKGGGDKELRDYITNNLERIKARKDDPLPSPDPPIVTFICNKVTYPTEAAAKASLRKIRGAKNKHKKPQRAYECPDCSGWHLTSQDSREWQKKQNAKTSN